MFILLILLIFYLFRWNKQWREKDKLSISRLEYVGIESEAINFVFLKTREDNLD